MSKIKTHYDNLGVMRTAQPEVIKAAYKALAQKYHPDRNPDNPDAERIMKIINTAYQVLIDPVRRAEHDKWIDEQERRAGQSHQSTNQSSNAYQNTANGSSSASHSNEHASQNTHHQTNGYQRYYEYANGNQNKHSHQNDDKHNSNNQQKHYYKNDDIQDEHGENKGSQLGLFFMPVIMTSLLSKLLFSVGIIFGFIATLLTFGVCSGCYSYTYEKVQSSKFIKEFFAILSGIFGCILWVIFLFFIADIFDYKQSSNDVQPNTTSQSTLSYQNAQNVNISSNDIKAPNTNSEPSLNPQLFLAEAKKRYDNAVANINAVWSSLPPSTQEFLRAEQRAINKNREADCTAYGNAQSTDRDLAKAYRYLCEVPQLNERAEYLKTQVNTVVTPSTQNTSPAYQSNQNGYNLNYLINDTVKKSLLFLDRDSASYDGHSHKLESQDITHIDVNHDGIKDAVVALRYCEVSNCHMTTKSSELAVYLGVGNNQYQYGDIKTLGIDMTVYVDTIGNIYTQSTYYSEHEDPACCPSMVVNNKFIFDNGKLKEIY